MSNQELNRNLFLSGVVSDSTVKPIIEKIFEINREDDKKQASVVGYDRAKNPIVLTVTTPGGNVSAGLGLIDVMRASKTPVHTVALGEICSMGIPIVTSGVRRFTYENTVFMIHDASYGNFGTVVQHERRLEVVKKFFKAKIHKIITDRTNFRQDELDDMDNQILDAFFDADEAVKRGVVDHKIVMTRLKVEDVKSGNFVVE